MSTLRVDNIQDNGSGFNDVVSFQNVNGTENGRLCRAWVNFNGNGAVAIRANFNVNSITDHGTGNYGINLANAMTDASYASAINTSDDNSAAIYYYIQGIAGGAFEPTSTTLRIYLFADCCGPADRTIVHAAFFR